MYRRALILDKANGTAIDRIAFNAILERNAGQLEASLAVVNEYLGARPGDTTLRMDRALVYQVLRRYTAAERDFATAAVATRDARAMMFAALDALHEGAQDRARTLLRRALRYDANFVPARRALERLS
jgi:hypothetical protein